MGKLRSRNVEHLLLETLDEFLAQPGARVLDVGAGNVVEKNHRAGLHILAERYARLIAAHRYVGFEIRAESKPTVVGDAHCLPFADASMDGVLMVSVLEHLYDPIRAVEQVYRVLKPGGIFFSYAPFYHPYHESPRDYFRFTLDGYRYVLRQFPQVEIISIGNYFAVLNDVLAYPLHRAGRVGRVLATVFLQLPLGIFFRGVDPRISPRLAAGFGARARK